MQKGMEMRRDAEKTETMRMEIDVYKRQGYDIIFFWVIRMVFSGLEQTGKEPFNTCLLYTS